MKWAFVQLFGMLVALFQNAEHEVGILQPISSRILQEVWCALRKKAVISLKLSKKWCGFQCRADFQPPLVKWLWRGFEGMPLIEKEMVVISVLIQKKHYIFWQVYIFNQFNLFRLKTADKEHDYGSGWVKWFSETGSSKQIKMI